MIKLMDLLVESNNKAIVGNFVKFVGKELELKQPPSKIVLLGGGYSQQHLSFGGYAPDSKDLYVQSGNRHIVDVLRTLAHELVHHKQNECGLQMDGNDGSDIENEANAVAGELMRKYRYLHPEIYGGK